MAPGNSVQYEGQACASCGRSLQLIEREATVEIFCESCGVLQSIMTTTCRDRDCPARIFFGGKNGKTPINIATGSNHFADCIGASRFRRK